MRPIRMTLTAFGPFPGSEVVDFRSALGARLFGIYGPTGAGKTSILDGICFALFGESSGQERKGDDLRSHHAPPATETEVSLVFEVGGQRYHVVRKPRQRVKGQRGATLVERPHYAALYDASKLEVDDISPDNPGLVLEERKVEAVGERIRSILGYSAAQFRQVVLLPQGQFRQLLTASSDERSAVLRGLFDVSVYERFVDRLKDEASNLRDGVLETRSTVTTRLGIHGLDDAAQLAGAIEALAGEVETLRAGQVAAATTREAAKVALDAANNVATLFSEVEAARKGLEALAQEITNIASLRARLSSAKQAQGCAAADALLVSATDALRNAEGRKMAAIEAEVVATATHSVSLNALAASNAREEERKQASLALIQHQGYQSKVKAAEGQLQKVEGLATAAAEAKARLDSAVARQDGARGLLELLQKLESLGREERDASAFIAATANVDQLERDGEVASRRLSDAEHQLGAAYRAEAAAESALMSAQAGRLASGLKPGTPCPVCGATEHTSPAILEAGSEDLGAALEAARRDRQAAEGVQSNANAAKGRVDGQLEQARSNLRGLKAPARELSVVREELAAVRDQLDLEFQDVQVDAPQKAVDAARVRLGQAEASYTGAREKSTNAASALASARAGLEATLADVPVDLRDPTALDAYIKGLAEKVHALQSAHQQEVNAERTAATKLAEATAGCLALDREVAGLVASQGENLERFNAALRDAGLGNQEYAAAKDDIPAIASLETEIGDHDERLANARGRLDRANEAIRGKETSDVAAASLAWTEADGAYTAAEKKLTETSLRLTDLQATSNAVAVLLEAMQADEARYGVIGSLARLADGNNDHRLRLRDFAIGATFDQVLEAANQRFGRMSRGRFTLLRKSGGGDGRSRSGLDIEVHDAHTDQKRDAHTLSGGEGFLASLSLALGLSDVVQAEAGGVKLDAIFIDEGFGHLDDETLDVALDTLRDLVGQDRAVGVISHVEMVKEQIPRGFDVVRLPQGSVVRERVGT
jgi:exonuclease SbcC